jgi:hypothetical protein
METNSKLNRMEESLLKALPDAPSSTELAVLTYYSQAVTKPYMRNIEAGCKGLDILNMGPLHEELAAHISNLVSNLALLLDDYSDSYLHGMTSLRFKRFNRNAQHREVASPESWHS